jgi:hypothetical protein
MFPSSKHTSHGWLFASEVHHVFSNGAAPDDGYPTRMSSYRLELGGILATLYIIYWIYQYYHLTSGKAKFIATTKVPSTKLSHHHNQAFTLS